MAGVKDIELPRFDFYQTTTHVILSLYIKGYGTPELKDRVEVKFEPTQVVIVIPPLPGSEDSGESSRIQLGPLYEPINPEQTTARILSTKIEVKLAKATASTWPRIMSDGSTHPATSSQPIAGPSTQPASAYTPAAAAPAVPVPKPKPKRNWDKVVDEELKDEEGETKDPNAGGDAALQTFFSKLYADADEDTRRAMIKSYTESGGTSLSTNWAEIQKEKTPVRPPEGMEAKKY